MEIMLEIKSLELAYLLSNHGQNANVDRSRSLDRFKDFFKTLSHNTYGNLSVHFSPSFLVQTGQQLQASHAITLSDFGQLNSAHYNNTSPPLYIL